MHRSQCRSIPLSNGRRSSLTAFIKAILPRGDSVSSPVARYVGQACRQKPQWTHLYKSDSSTQVSTPIAPDESVNSNSPYHWKVTNLPGLSTKSGSYVAFSDSINLIDDIWSLSHTSKPDFHSVGRSSTINQDSISCKDSLNF